MTRFFRTHRDVGFFDCTVQQLRDYFELLGRTAGTNAATKRTMPATRPTDATAQRRPRR